MYVLHSSIEVKRLAGRSELVVDLPKHFWRWFVMWRSEGLSAIPNYQGLLGKKKPSSSRLVIQFKTVTMK